jgi:hypothetical protein
LRFEVYSTPTMTKELECFEYTNDQNVIDKLYGIIRDDAKYAYRSAFKSYFLTEDEPSIIPTPFTENMGSCGGIKQDTKYRLESTEACTQTYSCFIVRGL